MYTTGSTGNNCTRTTAAAAIGNHVGKKKTYKKIIRSYKRAGYGTMRRLSK